MNPSGAGGESRLLKYIDALTGGPAWDTLRDRDRIELVWFRPARGLARRLESDPAWTVLHRDALSVPFRRAGSPDAPPAGTLAVRSSVRGATGD